MTNSEILKLAIERVELNGFNLRNLEHYHVLCDTSPSNFDDAVYYYVIFNHDFAKAFWGKELLIVDEHYKTEIVKQNSKEEPYSLNGDYIQSWKLEFPKWQFYLREMVLEEEPLKYLEKFL